MQHTRGLTDGRLAEPPASPVFVPLRSVGNVAKRAQFRSGGGRWECMRTTGRRLPRLLGAGVALALAVTLLSACFGTAEQEAAFAELNGDRSAHGLGLVVPHGELIAKAQSWADKLASENRLSHSHLPSGVPGCWRLLGENVGYGSSIGQVQDAFMNSPDHRANVLNGAYRYAGTGVAYRGDRVFVVQVFMQGC